jgi:phospholipase/carboxylesterase
MMVDVVIGKERVSLEAIAVPPDSGQTPEGLVVLLHGWGANFQDLLSLAPFLDLPAYQFIFPNAPFPHPYSPGGRMWYDFPADYQFVGSAEFGDRADLSASRQKLQEFLLSLEGETGIPLNRTILGGFSQGGAMTLDVGLHLPVAALMVLSGYLHAPIQPPVTTGMPLLMVHGRQDLVVPIQAARQARENLQRLGLKLDYQEYDMGHEIQPLVLEEIQKFVKQVLTSHESGMNP